MILHSNIILNFGLGVGWVHTNYYTTSVASDEFDDDLGFDLVVVCVCD